MSGYSDPTRHKTDLTQKKQAFHRALSSLEPVVRGDYSPGFIAFAILIPLTELIEHVLTACGATRTTLKPYPDSQDSNATFSAAWEIFETLFSFANQNAVSILFKNLYLDGSAPIHERMTNLAAIGRKTSEINVADQFLRLAAFIRDGKMSAEALGQFRFFELASNASPLTPRSSTPDQPSTALNVPPTPGFQPGPPAVARVQGNPQAPPGWFDTVLYWTTPLVTFLIFCLALTQWTQPAAAWCRSNRKITALLTLPIMWYFLQVLGVPAFLSSFWNAIFGLIALFAGIFFFFKAFFDGVSNYLNQGARSMRSFNLSHSFASFKEQTFTLFKNATQSAKVYVKGTDKTPSPDTQEEFVYTEDGEPMSQTPENPQEGEDGWIIFLVMLTLIVVYKLVKSRSSRQGSRETTRRQTSSPRSRFSTQTSDEEITYGGIGQPRSFTSFPTSSQNNPEPWGSPPTYSTHNRVAGGKPDSRSEGDKDGDLYLAPGLSDADSLTSTSKIVIKKPTARMGEGYTIKDDETVKFLKAFDVYDTLGPYFAKNEFTLKTFSSGYARERIGSLFQQMGEGRLSAGASLNLAHLVMSYSSTFDPISVATWPRKICESVGWEGFLGNFWKISVHSSWLLSRPDDTNRQPLFDFFFDLKRKWEESRTNGTATPFHLDAVSTLQRDFLDALMASRTYPNGSIKDLCKKKIMANLGYAYLPDADKTVSALDIYLKMMSTSDKNGKKVEPPGPCTKCKQTAKPYHWNKDCPLSQGNEKGKK